jgi:hypothetical protein
VSHCFAASIISHVLFSCILMLTIDIMTNRINLPALFPLFSIQFNLLTILLGLQSVIEKLLSPVKVVWASRLGKPTRWPAALHHRTVGLVPWPSCLAATCHPWRSAFSSYASKSTLYTLFPPLVLDPNVPFCSPRPFPNVARNTSLPKRPCYVTDLASQDTSLCFQIPLLSIGYGKKPSTRCFG